MLLETITFAFAFSALPSQLSPPSGIAVAQETQNSEDTAPENVIIVDGSRENDRDENTLEKEARAQVYETLYLARTGIPTPRFFNGLCLRLVGFPKTLATPFAKRLTQNVAKVGAPLASDTQTCEPNAIIALSQDPDHDYQQAIKQQRWAFGYARQSTINRIAKRSTGAVSWSLVECRTSDGKPTGQINLNAKPEPRDHHDICKSNRTSGGKAPPRYRNHILLSVTLIDAKQIDGMTIDQLADYATMRTLLLTDPSASQKETSLASILNLFATNGENVDQLTSLDLSLLSATYGSEPTASTSRTARKAAQKLIDDGPLID